LYKAHNPNINCLTNIAIRRKENVFEGCIIVIFREKMSGFEKD
jgi:hypothetical protein